MDVSRLRELTHCRLSLRCIRAFRCRNGCFPFKGIDTLKDASFGLYYYSVEIDASRLRELTHSSLIIFRITLPRRNGYFPFKGIDTLF